MRIHLLKTIVLTGISVSTSPTIAAESLNGHQAWSSEATVLNESPPGSSGESFRFTFQKEGSTGALRGRPLTVNDLSRLDVLTFWIRSDVAITTLQVRLQDARETYAERPVAELCGNDQVRAGKWHFVVWPFQHQPGWVHGTRQLLDYANVKNLHFYTDLPSLPAPEVHVDIHQLRLLTYRELLDETVHKPELQTHIGKALHVLPGTDGRHMMQYYYEAVAQEQAKTWPKPKTLAEWEQQRPELHKKFMAGLGDKSFYDGPLEPQIIRTAELDGVHVECLLYRAHPDYWATANIYIPNTGTGPWPAVVVLPGHGDVPWTHAAQERSAGFARQGFIVLFTESFACGAQGEYPEYSEYHGPQPAIGYYPLGMTLMGLEVNNHMRAVDYLLTRPDVQKDKIVTAGVSGGGTHSVFLIAADERIKASAPCSIAPVYDISLYPRHNCPCDTGVGIMRYMDDSLIMALAAPRALLRIYPSTENPVAYDVARQVWLGQLGTVEAIQKFKLTEAEANQQLFQSCREVYKLYGAEDRYHLAIIQGKHEYNKLMRETAVAWFNKFVLGKSGELPNEPPFKIIAADEADSVKARHIFSGFASKAERPADWVTPSQFQFQRAAALQKEIERHEPDEDYLKEIKTKTQTILNRRETKPFDGEILDKVELPYCRLEKIVLRGQHGLMLPMLLMTPKEKDKKSSHIVVIANPKGMQTEADSPLVTPLLSQGCIVALFDLRGTGETFKHDESSSYLGLTDGDLWQASMKIAEPILGQWLSDLEQVRSYLTQRKDMQPDRISFCGIRQAGNVALITGVADLKFNALVAIEPMASYVGEKYGKPYIYNHDNKNLEGYKSAAPVLPRALLFADIPQMAALNRPTRLLIVNPLNTNGEPLPNAFAWTKRAYEHSNATEHIIIEKEYSTEQISYFLTKSRGL